MFNYTHPLIPAPDITGEIQVTQAGEQTIAFRWEGGAVVAFSDELINGFDPDLQPHLITVTTMGIRVGPWTCEYLVHLGKPGEGMWVCVNWTWRKDLPIIYYDRVTGKFTGDDHAI